MVKWSFGASLVSTSHLLGISFCRWIVGIVKEGGTIVTKKEQLYYLLNDLCHGEIEINNFTIQFTKIFDLEIDYDELSEKEYTVFDNLSDMAGRFSDSAEDLKLPNVYYNEKQIRDGVSHALKELS